MRSGKFKNIYAKYCPLLYGVVLQICPVKKQAKQILIKTFIKIDDQDIIHETYPGYCITLMRLIIKTAQEEFYPGQLKNNFRLKEFENTRLLHQFLCHQISLENYCSENHLTQQEGLQIIYQEFRSLQNFKKENSKSDRHIA
jgi:hypothetical protein